MVRVRFRVIDRLRVRASHGQIVDRVVYGLDDQTAAGSVCAKRTVQSRSVRSRCLPRTWKLEGKPAHTNLLARLA